MIDDAEYVSKSGFFRRKPLFFSIRIIIDHVLPLVWRGRIDLFDF